MALSWADLFYLILLVCVLVVLGRFQDGKNVGGYILMWARPLLLSSKSYIDMQSLFPIKVITRFLLSVLGRGGCHMGLQEPLSLLCCPLVALWQSLGICSRRVHPSEGRK